MRGDEAALAGNIPIFHIQRQEEGVLFALECISIFFGEVAVSRKGRVLSTIAQGSSIGEMTYLQPNNRLRTATVVASTDVVAFKIRNEALRQASLELQGEFDKVFIKLLVNRLIATNQQLADWDLVLE